MLLSEIYKQYPYILDENYIVNSEMLTACTNRMLLSRKGQLLKSVNADL